MPSNNRNRNTQQIIPKKLPSAGGLGQNTNAPLSTGDGNGRGSGQTSSSQHVQPQGIPQRSASTHRLQYQMTTKNSGLGPRSSRGDPQKSPTQGAKPKPAARTSTPTSRSPTRLGETSAASEKDSHNEASSYSEKLLNAAKPEERNRLLENNLFKEKLMEMRKEDELEHEEKGKKHAEADTCKYPVLHVNFEQKYLNQIYFGPRGTLVEPKASASSPTPKGAKRQPALNGEYIASILVEAVRKNMKDDVAESLTSSTDASVQKKEQAAILSRIQKQAWSTIQSYMPDNVYFRVESFQPADNKGVRMTLEDHINFGIAFILWTEAEAAKCRKPVSQNSQTPFPKPRLYAAAASGVHPSTYI